jgi:hypothetical protein
MKKHYTFLILLAFISLNHPLLAQGPYYDSLALEGVIVETYYISDTNDAGDTDGGVLPEGYITYRVYIDLHPDYELQGVFAGNDEWIHELHIKTSTEFFNNEDRGEVFGQQVGSNRIDENTVALDSWLTMGAATDGHMGVLKSEDPDGSMVGGVNNDGGSKSVSGGLLVNNDPRAGIPLTVADGLVEGVPIDYQTGMELSVEKNELNLEAPFGIENSAEELYPSVDSTAGLWYVPGGARGPTTENRILIGQFTTDGVLSCKLNIQVALNDSVRCARCGMDPGCSSSSCHEDPSTFFFVHERHFSDHEYIEGLKLQGSYRYLYEYPDLAFSVNAKDSASVGTWDIRHSEPDIKIYPNPARTLITLEICNDSYAAVSYDLYNLQGKMILSGNPGIIPGRWSGRLNISHLSKGVYIMKVTMDEQVAIERIIKL